MENVPKICFGVPQSTVLTIDEKLTEHFLYYWSKLTVLSPGFVFVYCFD